MHWFQEFICTSNAWFSKERERKHKSSFFITPVEIIPKPQEELALAMFCDFTASWWAGWHSVRIIGRQGHSGTCNSATRNGSIHTVIVWYRSHDKDNDHRTETWLPKAMTHIVFGSSKLGSGQDRQYPMYIVSCGIGWNLATFKNWIEYGIPES